MTKPAEGQIAKARAQLTSRAIEFFDKLPHCIGYPGCDGDLEGMPHEPGCPLFTQKEMTLREKVVAFAASERQAVIEDCCRRVCIYCRTEAPVKDNPTKVEVYRYWRHVNGQICLAEAIRSMGE